MMRVRITQLAAVLAVAAALAGCSPPEKPLTALANVDGRPVALLARCPDLVIVGLTMYTDEVGEGRGFEGPRWSVARAGVRGPDVVVLFGGLPVGWNPVPNLAPLSELVPGQKYYLAADGYNYGGGFRIQPASISFTGAEWASLGPGEVLIGSLRGNNERVTEQEFRERARDSC